MTDPILHYASGHPTRLPRHTRLAEYLRDLGEPTEIRLLGTRYHLEWPPIYPGVPIPEYSLHNPWPTDKRRLVRIALDGERGTPNDPAT